MKSRKRRTCKSRYLSKGNVSRRLPQLELHHAVLILTTTRSKTHESWPCGLSTKIGTRNGTKMVTEKRDQKASFVTSTRKATPALGNIEVRTAASNGSRKRTNKRKLGGASQKKCAAQATRDYGACAGTERNWHGACDIINPLRR